MHWNSLEWEVGPRVDLCENEHPAYDEAGYKSHFTSSAEISLLALNQILHFFSFGNAFVKVI